VGNGDRADLHQHGQTDSEIAEVCVSVNGENTNTGSFRRFTIVLALVVGALSVLPFIYGLAATPPGARYIGFQYNTDDHMVYAAWMRQAMNGHFFFDNRFAVDQQPSLTIHVYFWALGLLAKITGISLATAISRFVFSFAFVLLLGRFVRLLSEDSLGRRLAMLLVCFGAGVGFLVWQPLGVDFSPDNSSILKGVMLGHLPNDVWQPEALVFPSLLTNSLFAVSLCLIIGILFCVIRAKDSWRPVPYGFVGFLLLMNIHSYDVLLLALVLIGLMVSSIVKRQLTLAWLIRVLVIGAGAIPSALWFIYVLRHDPVFQARAATETYTENFRSVFFGYSLFMLAFAAGAITWVIKRKPAPRVVIGLVLLAAMVVGMNIAAADQGSKYWMGMAAWCTLYAFVLVVVGLLARASLPINLVLSWAVIGLVAPYFPQLFERKLMMGLSVPWAILAGFALSLLLSFSKPKERRLLGALCVLVFAATSIRWLAREFQLIQANTSNTTMHPVYLDSDATNIIDYLNSHIDDQRNVVLAMPGVAASLSQPVSPLIPDLNPILSGFTGVYTYAGHWSETPDYTRRRNEATLFFVKMSPSERKALVSRIGAAYIVAPIPEKWGDLHPLDQRDLGTAVVEGEKWRLISVR